MTTGVRNDIGSSAAGDARGSTICQTDPPGVAAIGAEAAAVPERPIGEALAFFTPVRLAKIGILAVLFVALFHGTLWRLANVWWKDSDWSHGLLIPAFCVGILLAIRDRWLDLQLKPTFWGLVVIVGSLLSYIVATFWLKNIMLQDYSWWAMLVGLVLMLCGWRWLRTVWFPLFFILFAIRLSGRIYVPLTTKLKAVAAKLAVTILGMVGIDVEGRGVIITLYRDGREIKPPLEVDDACSGMHILMAFMALGVLVAYMIRRPWWHKLVLLLSILPIAVLSNSLRVATMGVCYYFERREWAEGLAHTLQGLAMLPVAGALFYLLHLLLSHMVVHEDGPGAAEEGTSVPPARPVLVAAPPVENKSAASQRPSGFSEDDAPDLPPEGGDNGNEACPRASARGSRTVWQQILAGVKQKHFAVAASVLLVAALSWTSVMAAIGAAFIKRGVPLKQALDRLPETVNSPDGSRWVPVDWWKDEDGRLSVEMETALGATCPYRLRGNRSVHEVPAAGEDAKVLTQPQYMQRWYRQVDPAGDDIRDRVVHFFVSYYTGTPDVVPHVPERCYVASGFTERGGLLAEQQKVELADGMTVGVRHVQFERISPRGGAPEYRNVAYLFNYNGRWGSDHKVVGALLSNPFGNKHAYFCKIELTVPGASDEQIRLVANDVLRDFLPVLVRDFLPDWAKYEE